MCRVENVEYAQVRLNDMGYVTGFTGAGSELPYTSLDKLTAAGYRYLTVLEHGDAANWPLLLFQRHKPAYTPGGVEIVSVRELLEEPQNRQAAG